MKFTKQSVFVLVALIFLFIVGCQEEETPVEQGTETEQTVDSETSVEEPKDEEEASQHDSDATLPEQETKPGKPLKVHFIDVGQGDSIFIQSPNGKTMLIDGGVKGEGKKVVEYIRGLQVNKLDYVVATHPDADHIGGLIPVLNSIKIGHFIDSGKVHTSETYAHMIQLVSDKNIKFTVPTTGDMLPLDSSVSVKVIHADEFAKDNNDASIVLKLTYGEVSFLLTGDAGIEMERLMLHNEVNATILKAGHHGSNTSSSMAFLQAVQPEATILSYGNDNKYGHPHAEVIENLRAIHSKIYGTGESGTIIVETDGVTYQVNQNEWTGIGATSSISPKPTPLNNGKIRISSKDLEGEIVGITNDSSESVSLKGWKLVSVQGNQTFNFPNISLAPGHTIFVTSGPNAQEGQEHLKWTGRQIWANDGDSAILYDAKGEIVDELD